MRDPGDVAVGLASLEEEGFSWVSLSSCKQQTLLKKKKKNSLVSLRTRSWGPQRALVPFCEDRQRRRGGGGGLPSAFPDPGMPICGGPHLQHCSAQSLSAALPQSTWEGRPLRRCCREVQALLPLNYSWVGWLAPSRHWGPVWMEREKLRCANGPIQGPRCWKFLPATHRTRPLSS